QPRQFQRFPPRRRPGRRRLRAIREPDRARRDHLLLDRRGHAVLGGLALALGGALEPHLSAGPLTRFPPLAEAGVGRPSLHLGGNDSTKPRRRGSGTASAIKTSRRWR